jgi:hypothetical protein
MTIPMPFTTTGTDPAARIRRNADGGGGGSPAPAPAPAGDPAPAPAPGAEKPWYETRTWSNPAVQQHLVKAGYHVGTEAEALERALQGEMTAAAKLGKPPGSLIDAPGKDQPVTQWMKANAKVLGIPDSPDGYQVKLPENLPPELQIDQDMLTEWKQTAHAEGLPPAVVQLGVDFLAKTNTAALTKLAASAALADEALTKSLQADWGPQYAENVARAKRAFDVMAAELKLEPDQRTLVVQAMEKGMGSAAVIKFMHHIAGKMGEDTLAIPRGVGAPTLQLAQAQQRKEAMMEKHTGDFARARGDTRKTAELQKELEGLNRIILQHGGKT